MAMQKLDAILSAVGISGLTEYIKHRLIWKHVNEAIRGINHDKSSMPSLPAGAVISGGASRSSASTSSASAIPKQVYDEAIQALQALGISGTSAKVALFNLEEELTKTGRRLNTVSDVLTTVTSKLPRAGLVNVPGTITSGGTGAVAGATSAGIANAGHQIATAVAHAIPTVAAASAPVIKLPPASINQLGTFIKQAMTSGKSAPDFGGPGHAELIFLAKAAKAAGVKTGLGTDSNIAKVGTERLIEKLNASFDKIVLAAANGGSSVEAALRDLAVKLGHNNAMMPIAVKPVGGAPGPFTSGGPGLAPSLPFTSGFSTPPPPASAPNVAAARGPSLLDQGMPPAAVHAMLMHQAGMSRLPPEKGGPPNASGPFRDESNPGFFRRNAGGLGMAGIALLGPAITGIALAATFTQKVLGATATTFLAVASAAKGMGMLKEVFGGVADLVKLFNPAIFTQLQLAIGDTMAAFGEILLPIIASLIPIVRLLGDTLVTMKPAFDPVIAAITDMMGILAQLIVPIAGILVPVLGVLGYLLKTIVVPALQLVVNVFKTIATAVKDMVNFVIDLLNGAIRGMNSMIEEWNTSKGLPGKFDKFPEIPKKNFDQLDPGKSQGKMIRGTERMSAMDVGMKVREAAFGQTFNWQEMLVDQSKKQVEVQQKSNDELAEMNKKLGELLRLQQEYIKLVGIEGVGAEAVVKQLEQQIRELMAKIRAAGIP